VLTYEKWEAAKKAGIDWDFDCLPMVTFTENDGNSYELGHTAAILRSFGIRYGYYDPKDWKMCRLVDPIVETWNDLMTALFNALNWKTAA